MVAADAHGCDVLVGECKWRNAFDETEAITALEHRADIVAQGARRHYVLFTKGPVSSGTREKLDMRDDFSVITAADLLSFQDDA